MDPVPFGLLPPGTAPNPESDSAVVATIGTRSDGRFGKGHDDRREMHSPGRPVGTGTKKIRRAARVNMARSKVFAVLAKIISGDIKERIGVTDEGEAIIGETRNSDRIAAAKLLLAYGAGLPQQLHTIVNPEGNEAPRPQVHVYIPDNGRNDKAETA